jgi:hypothetical protein
MEPLIWVEVLARGHEVQSRSRCSGAVIHIGRGYDNDVVLDDPHVAPRHLRLSRDAEGRWQAEDLGSLNGITVQGQAQPQRLLLVDGDRPLRIGNTWLRLRDAGYAVAPERALPRLKESWPLALGLCSGAIAWWLLDTWLGQTGEPRLSPYISAVMILLVLLLVWSGVWAVLSRIFCGAMRFSLHLGIACAGLLLFTLNSALGKFAGYSLSWGELAGYGYIGTWIILALACIAHLRVISTQRPALKAGLAMALAAVGVTAQAVSHSEARKTAGPSAVADTVQPPALRLAVPHRYDQFFARNAALRQELDKARSEEPGQEGDDDDDDDE